MPHQPDIPFPRLFCKPSDSDPIVYYAEHPLLEGLLSYASLHLSQHLRTVHQWVNMPYAKKYWQMEGSFEQLLKTYTWILEHAQAHSFVVFYKGKLTALIDVYRVAADELSMHIPEEGPHCGFHLLMAPIEVPIHGLTDAVVSGFLQYYFSFPEATKMYAEPDIRNQKSIALLKTAGFQFIKTISLSYKTAYLYCLDRETFMNQ